MNCFSLEQTAENVLEPSPCQLVAPPPPASSGTLVNPQLVLKMCEGPHVQRGKDVGNSDAGRQRKNPSALLWILSCAGPDMHAFLDFTLAG